MSIEEIDSTQLTKILQQTLGVFSKDDLKYPPRNMINFTRGDENKSIVLTMSKAGLLERFRQSTYRATTKGIMFLRENQHLIKFKD